ncbi:hypothetical protein B0H17DRAFT_1145309 [Mycena rosella]|uniref:Uncharacterized protein n=1 Tax=Mycena rosella TaxID=1033263 RepID=A0AAD7G5T3_MYCRO|nr:hypothetical protein B0H17DRAFT_1145309 [Mycena rosella]
MYGLDGIVVTTSHARDSFNPVSQWSNCDELIGDEDSRNLNTPVKGTVFHDVERWDVRKATVKAIGDISLLGCRCLVWVTTTQAMPQATPRPPASPNSNSAQAILIDEVAQLLELHELGDVESTRGSVTVRFTELNLRSSSRFRKFALDTQFQANPEPVVVYSCIISLIP